MAESPQLAAKPEEEEEGGGGGCGFGMELEDDETTLPDDIIAIILSYVPPKPQTRFKLVSHSFLTLLSDPSFHLLHLNRSVSALSLAAISPDDHNALLTLHLPRHTATATATAKLPLSFSSAPLHLVASCNGLLCVSSFPHFLLLINPTTSSSHSIPLLPSPSPHPSNWVSFGFGFDLLSPDYRLVRVDQFHQHGPVPREVHVFSLRDNSWTRADDFPHFLSHPMSHAKYLCNSNSLHWIASTTPPLVFDTTSLLWRGRLDDFVYHYVLLAFNLHSLKFTHLPLPHCPLVVPRLSVGVSGDSLFLQVEHGPRFGRCVDIWVMREYGAEESWTKLLSFPYMEARPELLPVKTLALDMGKGGHRVLMQQGKECFWVQGGSGEMRDVIIEGGLPFLFKLISGHSCVFGAEVFMESLVCVQGKGIQQQQQAGDEALQTNQVKGQKKRARGDLLSSGFKLI